MQVAAARRLRDIRAVWPTASKAAFRRAARPPSVSPKRGCAAVPVFALRGRLLRAGEASGGPRVACSAAGWLGASDPAAAHGPGIGGPVRDSACRDEDPRGRISVLGASALVAAGCACSRSISRGSAQRDGADAAAREPLGGVPRVRSAGGGDVVSSRRRHPGPLIPAACPPTRRQGEIKKGGSSSRRPLSPRRASFPA